MALQRVQISQFLRTRNLLTYDIKISSFDKGRGRPFYVAPSFLTNTINYQHRKKKNDLAPKAEKSDEN